MYNSLAEIERQKAMAEALSGNRGQEILPNIPSGLSYILNQYLAGKAGRKASEMEKSNEGLYQKELARVLAGPYEAQEVTPEQVSDFHGGSQQFGELNDENFGQWSAQQDDLKNQADFWTGVSKDRAEADSQWQPSHPDIQSAMLGQRMKLDQLDASTRAYANTANRQFAGDPVLDTAQNNRIVGYAQTNTGGPPEIYGLNGEPLEMTPTMYITPSAAAAEYMPDVLGTATPQQAATAGAIEGAEQEQMTIGANAREDYQSQVAVQEELLTGNREVDMEVLTDLREGASYAENDLAMLDQIEATSDQSPQGSLGNVFNYISGVFQSIGIPTEMYTDANVFQASSNAILANYMRQLGARGLTDTDMKILASTLPRFEQSREARQEVIGILRKAKLRTIDKYNNMLEAFDTPPQTFQPINLNYGGGQDDDLLREVDELVGL